MKVVFMGSPGFAVPSLQALYSSGFDIAGVFTQPDKPKGRGKEFAPTAVKQVAINLGLDVYTPVKIRNLETLEVLQKISPDVIVVVAYGKILPVEILSLPKYGCINVHASLLPKYRGAAPIHRAVINGDKITGITTMHMDVGLDTGDMIYKIEISIAEQDTVGTVHDKLASAGAELILKTLKDIEKGIAPRIKQDDAEATYAPILTKEDEEIIWAKDAKSIYNHVRGMNPFPGTYTLFRGDVIKVWSTEAEFVSHGLQPGQVIVSDSKKGLLVAGGQNALWLREVQPKSGKRMDGAAFVRGYKVTEGEILG